jgi:hypothetical protein
MTSDRDPRVGALLDVVEPQPARAGFWTELEDRLRREAAGTVELARVPVVRADREEATARLRRRLGLLTVAAAVIALLGFLALGDRGDEHDETGPLGPGPTTTATAPASTTTVPDPASPAGQALSAVDGWVGTVVAGDAHAGWQLLGPMARDAQGTEAAYARALDGSGEAGDAGLAAAFGPLVAPDRTVEAVAPLGGGDWVVVIDTPSDAGPVPHLLAVHDPTGTATVEPFLPGPALDLIGLVPSATGPAALEPGAPIPLSLDAGATGTVVLVDGQVAADRALTHGPDGAITAVSPDPELGPGAHRVAVAERLPDGTIAGDARAFHVGGGGGDAAR